MIKLITSILLTISMGASAYAATPQTFVDDVAGVYKTRFNNELVSGEKYVSEDILEIVPVNNHAAYVRMSLEFANGHSGRMWGIAEQQHTNLVYHNKKENCLMTLTVSKDMITTHADYEKYPGCSNFHGMRGTLDNLKFPRKNKRTIRYMTRLKNSEEFKEAMQEYEQSNKKQ